MAKYINFGAAGVTGLLYTSPAIFLDLPGSDHHGAGRCAAQSLLHIDPWITPRDRVRQNLAHWILARRIVLWKGKKPPLNGD
ncbi:uncharacterized protein PADG_11873 [Paracoccidioides brasiliensis Pb18]|uniref:Uncharacterized protein n=1 Tax=Paracoccidioides brasiliensis (strain Pb18) TaxID=502780 RepID=A0A0A0HTV8_PARBD|nr:uncharacterized protein PADG_11873 [Paracoccidioides brasiliensis Pb18]KGM92077.1 hypothetical protein PADG_11873 [Paracoccidioides brasiliensis Pb18]ODH45742.1 hypothetical protein GX48_08187 [Paracoccidioides brasiliensis]